MTEQSRLSERNVGEPPFGLAQGKTDTQTLGLLYKFLKRLVQGTKGVPGGFKDITPTPVIMGVAADANPGTKDKSWMAANAQQVLLTGVPAGLGNANAEGSSIRGARQDHQHARDVRVKGSGGADFIENAISFSSDFVVTDAAPNVSVALAPSAHTPNLARIMFWSRRV